MHYRTNKMTHVHNQGKKRFYFNCYRCLLTVLANYVDNQSFNMMMNVMMNTQSCYQPVNNYQLGSGVAQTGLGTDL